MQTFQKLCRCALRGRRPAVSGGSLPEGITRGARFSDFTRAMCVRTRTCVYVCAYTCHACAYTYVSTCMRTRAHVFSQG